MVIIRQGLERLKVWVRRMSRQIRNVHANDVAGAPRDLGLSSKSPLFLFSSDPGQLSKWIRLQAVGGPLEATAHSLSLFTRTPLSPRHHLEPEDCGQSKPGYQWMLQPC